MNIEDVSVIYVLNEGNPVREIWVYEAVTKKRNDIASILQVDIK